MHFTQLWHAYVSHYIRGLVCINVLAIFLILAVSCSGVALCLIVICVGVACLRR